MLVDNDDIISNDADIAETFNKFFVTIAESLSIRETPRKTASTEGLSNPVFVAINTCSNHPSIIKIKETCQRSESFSFRTFTRQEIEIESADLNSKKATTYKDVPPKLLKNVSDICIDHLLEIFNYCIENSIFPTELKCAVVSALHKKGETTKKNNYRPISILPTISKVLERLCDKQLSAYITKYLSPFLCCFRKDFSAQHALSRLLEKWKISLDSGGKIGAIFLDLSKAFDCLRHYLLIAKLEAYGLSHCA